MKIPFKNIIRTGGPMLLAACLGACGSTQGGGISEALDNASKQINESVGHIGSSLSSDQSVDSISSTGRHTVYEPISPAHGTLSGVFKGPNVARYDARDTGWPRVAITYLEWGRKLTCWKVRADIWQNSKTKTTETFRICDVPYIVKDDVGGSVVLIGDSANGYVGDGYVRYLGAQYSRDRWATTGDTRTTGPTPPKQVTPTIPTATSDMPGFGTNSLNAVKTLKSRHDDIYARIALVSGFVTRSQYGGAPVTLNDVRLWVAGFDQAGKKD